MLTQTTPTRFAGLDGLRAIAVTLVVVYHLFPGSPLLGGFVGVDVFFVISGFLITSLLLRPSRLGRLGSPRRLVDFWRRRARRLLPALAVVVTVCATVAWLLGGDLLVGMGRQVLGAATFSYNWLAVADGTDYFAATAPELFRNFWSLAVEEQFYVVWPLLLPLVLLIPGRWTRVALMLVAAGGSAWWMARLVAGGEVTRAYFGTDAHAFGILIGIALAFAVANMPDRAWMRSRVSQVGSLLAGAVGVAGIVVAACIPETPDAATFPGTLLLATFGSVLAVFAGVWPGSWFGRGMDTAPLKWVGDRSYGIYLWHWPVLVLVLVGTQGVGPEAGVPVWAGILALAISVGAATLSYRFVELPFRRYGFRHALRALGRRIAGGPMSRFAGIAALSVVAVAIGGTAAAVVNAPHTTTAVAAINRGAEALDDTKTPQPSPSPKSSTDAITIPEGSEITAVGDSVMLASAPSLLKEFPGIAVDAEVSRSIWAGPEILDGLKANGQLRENIVVGLGTNGPVDWETLEEMSQIAGADRNLILVNAHAPRDWIPGVNADLESFADSHRHVWVADWSGAITPHEDLLAGDGIHPGEAGGGVFAASVGSALERIEKDRIRAEKDFARAPTGRAPHVPFPE
ncbi:acetyltransferase [Microbacterium aerolatum]|uniref:acyltransferase family protein n=1 Tax=Microbacterium aerolatum TaxID=153731 RepID=UPI0020009672|nr:acyltransferase family protein [Microbacterium aerolatum]MCK3770004.1 acetyltransferase [Microbacterium aerolatum]